MIMYDSMKYPYSPHGRSLEIPTEGERGVSKATQKEKNYVHVLRGRGLVGAKQKTFHGKGRGGGGEYGYFLDLHNITLCLNGTFKYSIHFIFVLTVMNTQGYLL